MYCGIRGITRVDRRCPPPAARVSARTRPGFLLVLRGAAAAVATSLTLAASAVAQAATVSGRVFEVSTGHPVEGAFVAVEGYELAAITDSTGAYRLTAVPPGPQVIRVQRIGFAVARFPVTLAPGATVTRDVRLARRALEMQDITVTVDAVSRARGELATASVIDLQAIRNQTATSLAGVLELVPGVPLQPPGLGGLQQVSLRSAATSGFAARAGSGVRSSDLASFGTVIILDGIPISNNANLQSLGPRAEIGFTTSANGGIDLRRIPANTLERVEVIRGLPSVRYGDLTQGAVVVDTRAGQVAPEFSGQFDARTVEGSFVWGRGFQGPSHDGTMTFDVARSRIRPGISGDESVRIAGQLSHRIGIGRVHAAPDATGLPAVPRLTLDTRLDGFRLFEDLPEDPNLRIGGSSRVRDFGFRVSERASLRLGGGSSLTLTSSLSLVEQDARATRRLVRGAIPFTNRLTEGRQEGFFVLGPYTADVDVDGGPRLFFGRLELETGTRVLDVPHRLRLGVEPRREWNSGRGTFFDIERPPQVTFNGVRGFDRPRSNEDVGALVTSGLYVDDRVIVGLGGRSTLRLQGGLRLDLLHDGSTWFEGIRDAFLQPRASAEISPVPWLRLKGGWGRVGKAPTLSALFPAPQYFDLVNVNQFTNDPVERLAVLTTFIRDPANPDLGWTRATKAEAGIEVSVGGGDLQLTAFRDRIDGGVGFEPLPGTLLRDRFALTDSIIGNGIKPGILLPPIGADAIPILVDRPANIVSQINRGFELVASLPELAPIRTRLFVTGSFVETRQLTDALDFGPRSDFEGFQVQEVDERAPFWDPVTEYGRSALVTYRAIHHQPDLGLIITVTVQHNITDEQRDEAGRDTLAFAGFITREGELVRVPRSERGKPEFQDLRVPRRGLLRQIRASPADWLLSFQVSKTLPLDGRLNFWAFNAFDRRGVVNEPDVLPRPFAPVRFGLEVLLPVNGLLPGRGGG